MSDRARILASLRQHRLAAVEPPRQDGDWIEYDDRVRHFVEVLEGVGGQACLCPDDAAARSALAAVPAFQAAQKISSLLPDVAQATVDPEEFSDPHALADIDFAVLPGELAVAENAAVWVDLTRLRHRVLPFLTQHLALVVSEHRIYDNLHQAYATLKFARPGFGVFISGPSKTADIEQSLVIGAHGARSLTVLVVGDGA